MAELLFIAGLLLRGIGVLLVLAITLWAVAKAIDWISG